MPEERNTGTGTNEERTVPHSTVGENFVGPIGIVLITAYLILLCIFLLYSVAAFWPSATLAGESAPSSLPITFFGLTFSVSDEVRLLLIVALAGALGSLVHALRSFFYYVGNRGLRWSWLAMYVLLPFVGATLGLVFYLVIRGGFFSPEATVQQTSPFAFAALAGLVGLFSEQAVAKLKEVATTVFKEPERPPTRDRAVEEGQKPEAEPEEEPRQGGDEESASSDEDKS